MSKLKRILTAAAVLVTGSAMALGLALQTANETESVPLTCKQADILFSRVARQETDTFYVAVASGYALPAASTEYILGNCAGGVCTVKGDNCDAEITYSYQLSSPAGGWRLARVDAPLYFGRGWKHLASEQGSVKFWKGWKDVKAACLANLSAIRCRNLLGGVTDCWLRPDGQQCRARPAHAAGVSMPELTGTHGLYGPNEGGVTECSIGANDVPFPCDDLSRGTVWANEAPTRDFHTDDEMELDYQPSGPRP